MITTMENVTPARAAGRLVSSDAKLAIPAEVREEAVVSVAQAATVREAPRDQQGDSAPAVPPVWEEVATAGISDIGCDTQANPAAHRGVFVFINLFYIN